MTKEEADSGTDNGEDEQQRTTAEQRILDVVAETRGEEYVQENAELILAQARLVGEL